MLISFEYMFEFSMQPHMDSIFPLSYIVKQSLLNGFGNRFVRLTIVSWIFKNFKFLYIKHFLCLQNIFQLLNFSILYFLSAKPFVYLHFRFDRPSYLVCKCENFGNFYELRRRTILQPKPNIRLVGIS